jgi:serine protease Do
MRQVKRSIPWVVSLAVLVGAVFYAPKLAQNIAYAVSSGEAKAQRDQLAELSKHDQMSGLFSAVAKAVQPAVVVVNVRQRVQAPTVPGPDMDDFLHRFFGDELPPGMQGRGVPGVPSPQQRPREYFAHGLGSGVIVDAEKGYVLTNWHVVRDADDVEVTLADDRKEKAEWIRTDPQTDLAIIKIKADGLISAPLGDSDQEEVGYWVLAIGAPRGLSKTVTAGIISAKGRTTGGTGYESFLQTDAAINQGNSGGPLVNMRGEVIGVNSAIVTHMGGNEGIGFAIPSNMVKQVMSQLIEKGKVTRGYLGVSIENVDEDLARSYHLPSSRGALVTSVVEGGPAAKGGVKFEDFIVSVGGHKIANVNELRNEVAGIEPGKTVSLEIYRDGKKLSVDVKVEPQPKEMTGVGIEPAPEVGTVEKFGLKVSGATRELAQKYGYKEAPKGVIITEVNPRSDAAERGLQEGQTVLQAGGKDIATPEDFGKALSAKDAAGGVRLLVTDNSGGKRIVFVKPGKAPGKEEGEKSKE